MRLLPLVMMLAGCGRFGFSPRGGVDDDDLAADGSVPSDRIVVRVHTDGRPSLPVANAIVLIDRGGTVDRGVTDPTGTLGFEATAQTSFAVVYNDGTQWRVYQMETISPGTLVALGGRSSTSFGSHMTVTMPAASGTSAYSIALPSRCGRTALFGTNAVGIDFDAGCEGLQVRAIGEVNTPVRELDGTVTLASAGTTMLSGAYVAVQSYTVAVSNIARPASGDPGIEVALAVIGADNDIIYLGPSGQATPAGTAVTVTPKSALVPDAISLYAGAPIALPYLGGSHHVGHHPIAQSIALDASILLPQLTALGLAPNLHDVTWTLAPPTATPVALFAFEATLITPSATVVWTAYAPGSATGIHFPTLPADLAAADPAGGMWELAVAVGMARHGQSYAEIVPSCDGVWRGIEAGHGLLGDDSALTDIYYDIGLGPP